MSSEDLKDYSNYTVLFVDDEESILSSLRRGLIDEEYKTIFASSGLMALDMMSKNPVHVIVSDMKMPGMDGLTLLKEVKSKYPKTVRIVLSGYTQLQQLIATVNQADIFKFIAKPWKMEEEFTGIIRAALDYHILQLERDEFEQALLKRNQAYQNILKRIEDIIDEAKTNQKIIITVGNEIINNAKLAAVNGIGYIEIKNKLVAGMKIFNDISAFDCMDRKEYSIGELVGNVKETLGRESNISNLSIQNNLGDDFLISTNVNLLEIILKTTILSHIANVDKTIIKMIINKENLADPRACSISIIVSNKSNSNTPGLKDIRDKNTDSLIDLYNNVFDSVLRFSGGSFSCARVDINIVMKIIIGK